LLAAKSITGWSDLPRLEKKAMSATLRFFFAGFSSLRETLIGESLAHAKAPRRKDT
jgi:hypothetical protein